MENKIILPKLRISKNKKPELSSYQRLYRYLSFIKPLFNFPSNSRKFDFFFYDNFQKKNKGVDVVCVNANGYSVNQIEQIKTKILDEKNLKVIDCFCENNFIFILILNGYSEPSYVDIDNIEIDAHIRSSIPTFELPKFKMPNWKISITNEAVEKMRLEVEKTSRSIDNIVINTSVSISDFDE